MELFIQKRLKDLRVGRGLKPKQLVAQIYSSKSVQGSYETSPALATVRHAKTLLCFFAASNALAILGGNSAFAATPTEHITHYALQARLFATETSPLWRSLQKSRYASSLRGISAFYQPCFCYFLKYFS